MDCDKAKKLLTEHVDGLLAGDQRDALEGHVATCEGCSREFSALAEARFALRSAKRFTAPDGFASRVMGKIDDLDEESGFWSWVLSMPPHMKIAQGAAAAAVVFVGVYAADILSGRLIVDGGAENGDASLVASVSADYLDPVPPESIGEMYLSAEENGNEKQVP